MIRLLWRFLLLVLLAIAFAWLADRPGSITIRWLGREIEMTVVVAVAIGILLLGALLFIWNLLRHIWRSPNAAREYWRFRKHRKGYEALSRGIIAAGAGDAQHASHNAAIAGNALSDEPLVNVLAAQAAQLKGDKAGVKRIFEQMVSDPETELLGLRGLFSEARNGGDLVAALKHAERALALNPRLPWASTAVLQVQTARRSWEAAALTLEQQGRNSLIERKEAERRRAAMLAAAALAAETEDRTRALKLAYAALDLQPGLVPAASVAARALLADGSTRKAMKVLRNAWALSPHPDLAELVARAEPETTAEARYERLRDTLGDPAAHVEAALAIARAALTAGRVDVAREVLAGHAMSQPQARVCALMARIEDTSGDKGRSREWLARAIHATRDPMWVSDGVANTRWVPVSPVTGDIVPCDWKVPFDMPPPTDQLLGDATQGGAQAGPALAAPGAGTRPDKRAEGAVPQPRMPDDPGIDPGIDPDIDPGVAPGEERDAFAG